MPDPSWPAIEFDADPRVILGVRAGARRLDGRRIDVHEEAFAELRSVCEPVAAELRDSTPRVYQPFAQLEPGEEYFRVEIDELPTKPQAHRRSAAPETNDVDSADLVRLVASVDRLDPVADLDDFAYVFYAICWPADSGFAGFVKKTDPRRALRAGRRWFQYGDVLRRADPPDLVLEPNVDVVVTPTFVAARNPTAFKNLLNDVQVALAAVPRDVKAVRARLRHSVPLSKGAAAALEDAAMKRVSYARRLNLLPSRLADVTLDEATLRKELRRVGVPARALIGASGEFDFGAEEVGVFLDVLEARYFDDRLGGERRRADRYSTRN